MPDRIYNFNAGPAILPKPVLEKAAAALLARLQERKGSLSPENLKAVEANLAVIDGALNEVRAALEEDPANPGLVRMLASTHQKKIDVLQRVARHPMSL